MVIRVSLELEEKVVRESVRSVPAVPDRNFFVLSIGKFLSSESVVFNIVDCLKIENGSEFRY